MPNITLERFMIFNSSEGCYEGGERDKLLYHWTKSAENNKVDLAQQIDDICLCDASINVSTNLNDGFKSQKDCQGSPYDKRNIGCDASCSSQDGENTKNLVLTFDSTSVVIVEVEPKMSIWMAAHVVPIASLELTGNSQSSTKSSSTFSSQQHVFDMDFIPTEAIKRILREMYARFCFLNGTFRMICEKLQASIPSTPSVPQENPRVDERKRLVREKLRLACEDYFNPVLLDIHLNSILTNIAKLYNYILYLDLNPLTLMKVNSFMNHLVCLSAIEIRHTIVIFNDHLVWSSLRLHDTRVLFNYLTSVIIRDALQEELSNEVDKVRRILVDKPIYLSESNQETDNSTGENFEGTAAENGLSKFYMTLFRSCNNMTIGLILTKSNLTDLTRKCEQILTSDSRFGVVPLISLAQTVGQNFLKSTSSPQIRSDQQSARSSQPASASDPRSQRRLQQQSTTIGSQQLVASSPSRRQPLSTDQKYILMDRIDASLSLPPSMDIAGKEHLLMVSLHKANPDSNTSSKRVRFIRQFIDLEPDLRYIRAISHRSVEEFFGRTLSDSWILVTCSKYKTIYSTHTIKNSSLSEAQLSAAKLSAALSNNRL